MHMYLEHLKQKKLRKSNSPLLQRFFHVLPDDLFGGCVTYIYTNLFFHV